MDCNITYQYVSDQHSLIVNGFIEAKFNFSSLGKIRLDEQPMHFNGIPFFLLGSVKFFDIFAQNRAARYAASRTTVHEQTKLTRCIISLDIQIACCLHSRPSV